MADSACAGVGVADLVLPKGNVVRLYYPAKSGSTTGRPARFVPCGSSDYWVGYAIYQFAFVGYAPLRYVLIPLLRLVAAVLFGRAAAEGAREGAEAAEAGEDGALLPTVVFSHGLGSNRTAYAGLCSRVAASGRVVAAVEHLDGTAGCATDGNTGAVAFYRHSKGTHAVRRPQVLQRVAEVRATLDLLHDLDAGRPLPGGAAAPPGGLARLLDLEDVSVAGHSMGGATAVLAASADARFKACIAMDPYLLPTDLDDRASAVPLCVLMSHKWQARWTSGPHEVGKNTVCLERLLRLRTAAEAASPAAVYGELVGTAHMSASDIPRVLGPRLAALVGGKKDSPFSPEEAVACHAALCVEFLETGAIEETASRYPDLVLEESSRGMDHIFESVVERLARERAERNPSGSGGGGGGSGREKAGGGRGAPRGRKTGRKSEGGKAGVKDKDFRGQVEYGAKKYIKP